MLPKLIKVQMSVPNGDSTQLPSQGFATNNSKKFFKVSYPGGQNVWRDYHIAKDQSHRIQSDELSPYHLGALHNIQVMLRSHFPFIYGGCNGRI